MPVQRVIKNGNPGYRWGDKGKVYTYTPGNKESRERAKRAALRQGKAIEARKSK